MCVSKAARGEAEPSSVQAALTNNPMPGTVDLGIDVTAGQFVVDVMVASKERQCELDQAAVRGGRDTDTVAAIAGGLLATRVRRFS